MRSWNTLPYKFFLDRKNRHLYISFPKWKERRKCLFLILYISLSIIPIECILNICINCLYIAISFPQNDANDVYNDTKRRNTCPNMTILL